ncbi:MAG TPA: response regulator [bacterium]|nr:response regulator [bacterium]
MVTIMPVRKIRIALIEDSPTTRFFYKSVFAETGFEVFEAENARDGWAIICEQKPDIIILDMMMPDIHGIELLKRIRGFAFSKDIPVLVLSSVSDGDQVQAIFREGANHFSLKGMDSPELIKERVYQLLKDRKDKESESPPDKAEEVERQIWWV